MYPGPLSSLSLHSFFALLCSASVCLRIPFPRLPQLSVFSLLLSFSLYLPVSYCVALLVTQNHALVDAARNGGVRGGEL